MAPSQNNSSAQQPPPGAREALDHSRRRRRHAGSHSATNLAASQGTAPPPHRQSTAPQLSVSSDDAVNNGEGDESRRARRAAGRAAANAQHTLVMGTETSGLSSRTRTRRSVTNDDAPLSADVPRRTGGILSRVADIDRAREDTELARQHREEQKSKPKCGRCGRRNDPKANFCSVCGNEMKNQQELFAERLASVENDGGDNGEDALVAAIDEASRNRRRNSTTTSNSNSRRRHH